MITFGTTDWHHEQLGTMSNSKKSTIKLPRLKTKDELLKVTLNTPLHGIKRPNLALLLELDCMCAVDVYSLDALQSCCP